MYVLVRVSDNKFVAKSGLEDSYTDKLWNVRVFETAELAEKNRCVESECIVRLESIVK